MIPHDTDPGTPTALSLGMDNSDLPNSSTLADNELYSRVTEIITVAQTSVTRTVNTAMVHGY